MKQYDFFYYESGAVQTEGSVPVANNFIRLTAKNIWEAINNFKKLYELAPPDLMDMVVTQICELS